MSAPVAASTTLTVWAALLPLTTHRPRPETDRSLVPTLSRIPTQPEKSVRRPVGVKEETNDVPVGGGGAGALTRRLRSAATPGVSTVNVPRGPLTRTSTVVAVP